MRAIKITAPFSDNSWLETFRQHLNSLDLSPTTVRGYLYDINHFRDWLSEYSGNHESFENVVPVDISAYRQHMNEIQRMKATSVNRRIRGAEPIPAKSRSIKNIVALILRRFNEIKTPLANQNLWSFFL